MGCGGCGGKAAATVAQNRVIGAQQVRPKATPRLTQVPKLRPSPTTKVVIGSTPRTTIKTKQQLRDLKVCPLCNSTLTPILTGNGAKNRKRCLRCNRTFV
jgi:hypothetical protein